MKKEKSQLSGYLLIAMFVVPLLIAVAMYSMRDHLPAMKTASHGELIHPAEPIKSIQIKLAENKLMNLESLQGKWTYLVYSPDQCGLECEASLFKVRQTKIASGRESNRIQSALLTNPNNMNSQVMIRNHRTAIGELINLELESKSGVDEQLMPGTIYLVDPNGNMMMQYNATATSRGMLKDIKKLLKISNIG